MNNADTISFLGKTVQHKVQLLIIPRSNKGNIYIFIYGFQSSFMSKVVRSMKNNRNGLLNCNPNLQFFEIKYTKSPKIYLSF